MSAHGRLQQQARRTGRSLAALARVGTVAGFAVAVALGLAAWPGGAGAQADNLINRISSDRMNKFEETLTGKLNTAISRYVSKKQYVMAVKVIWNPEIVPLIENPQLSPEQQKLPGFPIFVRSPDSPATEDGTPPYVRLEVKVLIDETLPEYYERFVRKMVPIEARMDFNRGDSVVVLKETFPVLPKEEEPPPTLSEQELMRQLGQTPPPGQLPPQQFVPVPGAMAAPGAPPAGAFTPQTATSPAEAAQMAYDEGRYNDALRIVQSAFQRATTNRERGYYLGLEGSILYTQGNAVAAKQSWKRAITYDPTNLEVHEVLNYVEPPNAGPQP